MDEGWSKECPRHLKMQSGEEGSDVRARKRGNEKKIVRMKMKERRCSLRGKKRDFRCLQQGNNVKGGYCREKTAKGGRTLPKYKEPVHKPPRWGMGEEQRIRVGLLRGTGRHKERTISARSQKTLLGRGHGPLMEESFIGWRQSASHTTVQPSRDLRRYNTLHEKIGSTL